jgi:hypothetical protein
MPPVWSTTLACSLCPHTGLQVLDALGYKESERDHQFIITRLPTGLEHVQAFATAILGSADQGADAVAVEPHASRCPLPDFVNAGETGTNRALIDVYEPTDDSTGLYPGGLVKIRWRQNGRMQHRPVRIRLCQGDFDREVLNVNGRPSPRYLKFIAFVTGAIENTREFDWEIPTDIPPGDYYKIQVDEDGGPASDQSLAFSILPASEAAAKPSAQEQPFRGMASFNNGEVYKRYLYDRLAKLPDCRHADGSAVQVTLRAGGSPHPANFTGKQPLPGMRGTFLGWTRFNPPVRVLWLGPTGEFEYPVQWQDIEVVNAHQADHMPGGQPLGGGAFAAAAAAAAAPAVAGSAAALAGHGGPVYKCWKHPEGHDVFLSYRREDSNGFAKTVCISLEQKGKRVFFDRNCLVGGLFAERLRYFAQQTPVFMPLLTSAYLNAERFNQDGDFCRMEFVCALSTNRAVLPVVEDNYQQACFRDTAGLNHEGVRRAITTNNVAQVNWGFYEASLDRINVCITDLLPSVQRAALVAPPPPVVPGVPGVAVPQVPPGPRPVAAEAPLHNASTVGAPAIEVSEPREGLIAHVGQSVTVVWHCVQVERVNIKLYERISDTKLRFTSDIASRIASVAGRNTYVWKIGSFIPTGQYFKIVVECCDEPAIRDQSFAFDILPAIAEPRPPAPAVAPAGADARVVTTKNIRPNVEQPLAKVAALPSPGSAVRPVAEDNPNVAAALAAEKRRQEAMARQEAARAQQEAARAQQEAARAQQEADAAKAKQEAAPRDQLEASGGPAALRAQQERETRAQQQQEQVQVPPRLAAHPREQFRHDAAALPLHPPAPTVSGSTFVTSASELIDVIVRVLSPAASAMETAAQGDGNAAAARDICSLCLRSTATLSDLRRMIDEALDGSHPIFAGVRPEQYRFVRDVLLSRPNSAFLERGLSFRGVESDLRSLADLSSTASILRSISVQAYVVEQRFVPILYDCESLFRVNRFKTELLPDLVVYIERTPPLDKPSRGRSSED